MCLCTIFRHTEYGSFDDGNEQQWRQWTDRRWNNTCGSYKKLSNHKQVVYQQQWQDSRPGCNATINISVHITGCCWSLKLIHLTNILPLLWQIEGMARANEDHTVLPATHRRIHRCNEPCLSLFPSDRASPHFGNTHFPSCGGQEAELACRVCSFAFPRP